jgi:hypothetical protein
MTAKERFYPQHPVGKGATVSPELLNQHQRFTLDLVYDTQTAIMQMNGGATGIALFSGGAVTSILLMYPGFGYIQPPAVVISGGGGSGAKAVASVKHGRVGAIAVTAGGAGYTSTPTVTITP